MTRYAKLFVLVLLCFLAWCGQPFWGSVTHGAVIRQKGGEIDQRVDDFSDKTGLERQDAISSAEPTHAQAKLSNRLLLTSALVGILLGQLSVLFGYLKINHATRGFYSGRLQSIAAVASMVVFAAGYIFYTSWML